MIGNSLESEVLPQYQDQEGTRRRMAEAEAERARLMKLMPQDTQPQGVANPSQPVPVPEETGDEVHTWGQHAREILPAVASGGFKFVSNTSEALDEVIDWGVENLFGIAESNINLPFSDESNIQLPDMQMETTTGKVVEGFSQFMTGFIPIAGQIRKIGLTGKFVNGLVAGAAVDYAGFDPDDATLAEMINEHIPSEYQPMIREYLANDVDDTVFEKRLKNMAEGALTGVAADALLATFRGIKGKIGTKAEVEPEAKTELTPEEQAIADAEHAERVELAQRRMNGDLEVDGQWLTKDELTDKFVDSVVAGGDIGTHGKYINLDTVIENPDEFVAVRAKELDIKLANQNVTSIDETAAETAQMMAKFGKKQTMDEATQTAKGITNLRNHTYVVGEIMKETDAQMKALIADGGLLVKEGRTIPVEKKLELKRLAMLQNHMTHVYDGTKSAVGGSLRIMREHKNGHMLNKDELNMIVEANGGEDALDKLFEAASTLKTDEARANMINNIGQMNKLESIQYYWYNSLLSGYGTQQINALGNLSTLMHRMTNTYVAAGKNLVTPGGGTIHFEDANAGLMGMMHGLSKSLSLAGLMGRATGSIDTAGKVVQNNLPLNGTAYTAFKTGSSPLDPFNSKIEFGLQNGRLAGPSRLLGTAISIPSKGLAFFDDIFKSAHYYSTVYRDASIQAREMGLDSSFRGDHLKGILEDPTTYKKFHDNALREARVGTFQDDVGVFGKHIQNMAKDIPMLRFIVPFVRTPLQLLNYAAESSPLMATQYGRSLVNKYNKEIAAGGARAEMAKAKMQTGTMFMAMAGLLALDGRLTGGVHEDWKNGKKRLMGDQSYAIKYGENLEHRIEFSRLDPFGLHMGLMSDMAEAMPYLEEGEYEDAMAMIAMSLSENVASKTYLKGMVDFFDVFLSHGISAKSVELWAGNFTSSFIPNIMNQVNRTKFDTAQKDLNHFVDPIMSKIWKLSDKVGNQMDELTGEDRPNNAAMYGGAVYIKNGTVHQDKVRQEMFNADFAPKETKQTKRTFLNLFGKGSVKIDLDVEEMKALVDFATTKVTPNGRNLYETLEWVIDQDWYQTAPPTAVYGKSREKILRNVVTDFYKEAESMMVKSIPSVQRKIRDAHEAAEQVKMEQMLLAKIQNI